MPTVAAGGPDHRRRAAFDQELMYDLVDAAYAFDLQPDIRFSRVTDDVARNENEVLRHCRAISLQTSVRRSMNRIAPHHSTTLN